MRIMHVLICVSLMAVLGPMSPFTEHALQHKERFSVPKKHHQVAVRKRHHAQKRRKMPTPVQEKEPDFGVTQEQTEHLAVIVAICTVLTEDLVQKNEVDLNFDGFKVRQNGVNGDTVIALPREEYIRTLRGVCIMKKMACN